VVKEGIIEIQIMEIITIRIIIITITATTRISLLRKLQEIIITIMNHLLH